MRKLSSIAGAALLAMTAFATPASAQGATAGGSCGQQAGDYGMTDVNSAKVNQAGHTVPALFYTVNYSGVPAPTTIGVIVRYNGELESQVQVASASAANTGGVLEGALRANISPDAQGFANSIDAGIRGRSDGAMGGPGGNESGNKANGGARGGKQNSPTQGGLLPGEYVFYIYTGAVDDVWNVKDGTVARNAFVADQRGYLGMFSCGVSTDQGSGPG
jgi:hypothetical protein